MKVAVLLMVWGLMVGTRTGGNGVEVDDFLSLVGKVWVGTVTTKPVGTGGVVKQALELEVKQDEGNPLLFLFHYVDPAGKNMEVTRQVELAKNGRKVDGAKVLQVSETKIGAVEVVTEKKVDGKGVRRTYIIGRERFGMREFERGKGEEAFVEQVSWEFVVRR